MTTKKKQQIKRAVRRQGARGNGVRRKLNGWKRDAHDHRDLHLAAAPHYMKLPRSVDLRPMCPPIYDQKDEGSCTANMVVGAYHFTILEATGGRTVPDLSRQFQYWVTRKDMGTVNQDSGASIRGAFKSAAKWGICHESLWPYSKPFKTQPSDAAFQDAKTHVPQATMYARAPQELATFKAILSQNNPIGFGFDVGESFMSNVTAQTGNWMPKDGEKVVGGHAMLIVGYDDNRQAFLCRNSWGTKWGMAGYVWIPYSFLMGKKASDFWVVLNAPAWKVAA